MIKFFDSHEEMQEYQRKMTEFANSIVQPWQKDIPANDKGFIIIEPMDEGSRLIVYGRLEESPYPEDRALFRRPGMEFRRMAKFFSIMCPEGELDTLHVAKAFLIFDLDALEMFRKADWPNDARMVARLFMFHYGVARRCPECDGTGTEATIYPLTFGCEPCYGTGVVNP